MSRIHRHLALPYVLGHLLHQRRVQGIKFRGRSNKSAFYLDDLSLILLLAIEASLVVLSDRILLEYLNMLLVDLGLILNQIEMSLQGVFLVLLYPQVQIFVPVSFKAF